MMGMSPLGSGLLGVVAAVAVLYLLKGHIEALRRGDPFVLRRGIRIERGHPGYRRVVAISFVGYAVALALSFVLVAAMIAQYQPGLG
jgi:hypothetical protein